MIRVRSVLIALGAGVLGAPLVAQSRPAVSVDASAGLGVIEGAAGHNEHVGVALDATVGWRLRPSARGSAVFAVSGGAQGSMASNDICIPLPGGGCRRDFTRFYSVGALAGWQVRGYRGASLRFLTGPAYYRALARDRDGRNALGVQGRIDIVTPALRRIAVVASVRGAALPGFGNVTDRPHTLGAVAVGLRVQ